MWPKKHHNLQAKRDHPWLALTIVSALLALISVSLIFFGDSPLTKGQTIAISASENETLTGTYYPGIKPVGVILLEGFGSDQVTMRSAASEFVRSGLHVLTFDFSGHGRSPGALTFDNAATDRLACQVLAATDVLKARSGLTNTQIFLLGHSMGARVGLQAATINVDPFAGLILLGTQVNLATNVQSEVFTGIRDSDLDWIQKLGPNTPSEPILLISGRWDDILTPKSAELLYEKFTGGKEHTNRNLVIFDHLLHNYEVFSPRVLRETKGWMEAKSGVSLFVVAPVATRRLLLWVTGWLGLIGAILAAERWAVASFAADSSSPSIRIINLRRFLWAKLWLWIVALPLIVLVFAFYWFVPLATPVFNLIYVGFIGGYGLLNTLLYGVGKMPGVSGKLNFWNDDKFIPSRRHFLLANIVGLVLLIFTATYARTGWFYVPPTGTRFLWMLLFIPPTTLGFRIGRHEANMLSEAAHQTGLLPWGLTAVGLLPFFLWTGFQAAIGSLSGMVGGLQGLLILALVLTAGDLLACLIWKAWYIALFQAVLLYWLVLPQGVLFQ